MSSKFPVFLNLIKKYHPVYHELVLHPPENVEYSYPHVSNYYDKSSSHANTHSLLKTIYSYLPAVYYVQQTGPTKLIHSTNSLLILNNMPWVVDTEHAGGFLRFRQDRFGSSFYKNIISSLLRRRSCKGILAWSEASKKSIWGYLRSKELLSKTHVIYPAISPSKLLATKPSGTFKFLFIGRVFYEKGGREVLMAFSKIRKRFDCTLTFIGSPPQEFKLKYAERVTFIEPNLTREEVRAILPQHHALLFPTLSDTFGFVILEALAAGLPVISTDIFCIPEIIEDHVSGLLVKSPLYWHNADYLHNYKKFQSWEAYVNYLSRTSFPSLVTGLEQKMSDLVENSDWTSYSHAALKSVSEGKFSIKHRNSLLEIAYSLS